MKYNAFSRRLFLQGVGASLTLPMLISLMPKSARAAAVTTTRKKFVSFLSILGQIDEQLYPFSDPTTQAAPDVFHSRLSSLPISISPVLGSAFDSLKNDVSILRGLCSMDGHDHNKHLALTGSQNRVFGDSGDNTPPTFPYSLDTVLGESSVIYPQEPYIRVLRLAPSFGSQSRSFSWTSKNGVAQNLPAEWDYKVVSQRLFGTGSGTKTTPNQLSKVMNSVHADYKKLIDGRQISSEDRQLLALYTDSLADISRRLSAFTPLVCAGQPAIPETLSNYDQVYKLHMDLALAALICGATNIVTISIPHMMSDPDQNPSAIHGDSHDWNSSAEARTRWMSYKGWVGEKVAYFMNRMKEIKEADGNSMLYNSIVFWGDEMGNASAHKCGGMPSIIGGSAGGKLRSGYYIDYRQRPFKKVSGGGFEFGRPYNEVLVTMAQAMGLSPAQYQREGRPGFGSYNRFSSYDAVGLAKFKDAPKDNPLPFLFNV